MPFDPDLTTEFSAYLQTLRDAAAIADPPVDLDVSTVFTKDIPVVVAATEERADRNTQLLEHLT